MIPSFLERRLEITGEIWHEVSGAATPADRWLNNYFYQRRKKFGSQDRRFYSETVFCLFRHKTFLDAWSRKLFPGQEIWGILLLAVVLEELATPEEIFDCGVKLGRSLKEDIVQKIKKFELPVPKQGLSETAFLSLRYSFPEWLATRWLERYGRADCEKLLALCQERPPLTIRANSLKITRDELVEKFRAQNFKVKPTPESPWGIVFEERSNIFDSEEFREGLFEVQDEGSQLLGLKINPKPGEFIWDVCAGGGGKTLHLGALTQNKGRIVATDIRPKKMEELAKRAKRAGLFNVFPADLARIGEIKHAQKGFDRVLVDAPCTGTGTLRRNPDAKWKLSIEKIMYAQKDQLAILENALPYLRAGGRMYYATCSLEPEENEQVMAAFLGKHPELKAVPAGDKDGFFRLLPHLNQTDGFFLGIVENGRGDSSSRPSIKESA